MTYNDVGIATVVATYAMFVVAIARLAFWKIVKRKRQREGERLDRALAALRYDDD